MNNSIYNFEKRVTKYLCFNYETDKLGTIVSVLIVGLSVVYLRK